ncbi:hypothetical protein C8T65DRAFT_651593 [Cerioporus squamosus]|nr:hypothetical protein C8T65DRAFT_651593 [Cerioporus squamosus]
MYSTRPDAFRKSRGVRVALTCFAVETVMKKLVREAEKAIQPENGLHASRKCKRSEEDPRPTTIRWEDIGAATMPRAASIIEQYQPVLRALLLAVAERARHPKPGQEGHTRMRRPAELEPSLAGTRRGDCEEIATVKSPADSFQLVVMGVVPKLFGDDLAA